MKKRRNVFLLLAVLLASCYLLLVFGIVMDSTNDSSGGLTILLMTPHLILLLIGVLFGWVGFATGKAGFSLAAAILYSVSAALAIMNALFLVPSIILGFIGYANQKS